jgi:hypothetical protein
MKPFAFSLVVAGVSLLAAATAVTARAGTPPVAAIASDLGVGVDDLVACTLDARSHAEGAKGSPERKALVRALVLACLQDTRPDLTAAQFDAAVAKYRPAGESITD